MAFDYVAMMALWTWLQWYCYAVLAAFVVCGLVQWWRDRRDDDNRTGD